MRPLSVRQTLARFIDLFNHIIWLQYMQEQSRQTLLPGLKLSYEHPPFVGRFHFPVGLARRMVYNGKYRRAEAADRDGLCRVGGYG